MNSLVALAPIIWPGVSIAANLWMWFVLRRIEVRKVDEAVMDAIRVRLDAHGNRLTALESSQQAGPNSDDIRELHNRVTALTEEFHELAGQFSAANSTLKLIQQYMLTQGNRQ